MLWHICYRTSLWLSQASWSRWHLWKAQQHQALATLNGFWMYIVLIFNILYYIILCYIIFYYIVLYYTLLYVYICIFRCLIWMWCVLLASNLNDDISYSCCDSLLVWLSDCRLGIDEEFPCLDGLSCWQAVAGSVFRWKGSGKVIRGTAE